VPWERFETTLKKLGIEAPEPVKVA